MGSRRSVTACPLGWISRPVGPGSDPSYFVRVLSNGAADVVQADATRCGGVTGFMATAALSAAWNVPFSSHTAPSIHAHVCAAAPELFRHLEYFRDHVRLEEMLFEGAPRARNGELAPDRSRPGVGTCLW